MAISRKRSAEAIARSGGQESEALMSYLTRVKDECKPAIYSAFICLMNAYHGNMLAVDAFLDELFVLFSPRVFLLAGVKPLVDKTHHARIDELCDKVRQGVGIDGFSAKVETPFDASRSFENQAAIGGAASRAVNNNINNNSSNNKNNNNNNGNGGAEPRPITPPRFGGTGGSEAGSPTTRVNPRPSSACSGARSSSSNSNSSSSSGASGSGSGSGSSGCATGLSTTRNTASGGSPGGMNASLTPLLPAGDVSAGGGGGSAARSNEQQLEGILGSSPGRQALSTDTSDIGDLLTDIEPTVDPALLDFMMCDNSPTVGASVPQFQPPPLSIQQQPRQQQQQQQSRHWSPSALAATTPGSHGLPPKFEPGTERAGGSGSVGASPTKKRRASADPPTNPPTPAERHAAELYVAAGGIAAPWHRSESAPNLADLSCRIHATPNVGCRTCRGAAAASAPLPAATALRRQSNTSVSTASPSSSSSRAPSAAGRGPGLPVPRQGPFGAPGGSSSGGVGGGGGIDDATEMDEGGYLGPGKRIWEKRSGGSAGGGGMSVPSSSPSPPESSFYFPSAAAAAIGGSTKGGAAPSRSHMKRKASADALPAGIKDEHGGVVARKGRSDPSSPTGIGSGGRFASNGIGGVNGSGGGGGSGGVRSLSLPMSSLGSDVKGGEVGGIGSPCSMSITEEPSSTGGVGGSSSSNGSILGDPSGMPRSGDDLEKLVINVTTKSMQQALQYGLRHTFSMVLHKKDREIAELKEEALRWSANDTRLRQINQQLLNENIQLRAGRGWDSRTSPRAP